MTRLLGINIILEKHMKDKYGEQMAPYHTFAPRTSPFPSCPPLPPMQIYLRLTLLIPLLYVLLLCCVCLTKARHICSRTRSTWSSPLGVMGPCSTCHLSFRSTYLLWSRFRWAPWDSSCHLVRLNFSCDLFPRKHATHVFSLSRTPQTFFSLRVLSRMWWPMEAPPCCV